MFMMMLGACVVMFVVLCWAFGISFIQWKEGDSEAVFLIPFVVLFCFLSLCLVLFFVSKMVPESPWEFVCSNGEMRRERLRADVERWSEERFGNR